MGINWRVSVYTENTDASTHVAKQLVRVGGLEPTLTRLNDAVVSRVRENFHLITREVRQVQMQEFFPESCIGKSNTKKEGVVPTTSFWNPSSDVCSGQVGARSEQLPPAGWGIIQEYDTPLDETTATRNNAHALALHLHSLTILIYLPRVSQ